MSLKQLKQDFVSNLSGGSIAEIYSVTGVAIAGVVSQSICARWPLAEVEELNGPGLAFVLDLLLNVVLLLNAITVSSSNRSPYLHALIPGVFVLVYKALDGSPKRPSKRQPSADMLPKKAFITSYRALMLILTNLAILGVDFHIFPRRFAKVETWGTSLMDLGVGSFVFAMGLASSRAVVRLALAQKQLLVARSLVKSVPILALGAARLLSVKGLDYQEHVTEYGVHWNFFFTLGLLPPLLALLNPVLALVPRLFVALAVAAGYEWALVRTNLLEVILDESNRTTNLLTMNKEGVFSTLGYLSIFLFGQLFGSFVLPARSTPNNLLGTYPKAKPIRWLTVSTTRGLLVSSAVSGLLFHVARELLYTTNISRRLANLSYVLWVVSYNSAFLLAFHVAEQVFGPAHSQIMEAVNNNGLAVFLLANVCTGVVNMSVNTLACGAKTLYAILFVYALVWVLAALALNHYKVYLKL